MNEGTLFEAAKKAFNEPFGAVLELRPETSAPIFVDGRPSRPLVSDRPPADAKNGADCVWRCPDDIMARVLVSKRAIESAVINGRLVIAGDMSVMARLRLASA